MTTYEILSLLSSLLLFMTVPAAIGVPFQGAFLATMSDETLTKVGWALFALFFPVLAALNVWFALPGIKAFIDILSK